MNGGKIMSGLGKEFERISGLITRDSESEWTPDDSDEFEFPEGRSAFQDAEKSVSDELKHIITRVERLISRSILLKAYRFDEDDLLMIAEIWHRTMTQGEQDFSMKDICAMRNEPKGDPEGHLACVANLIDREIITAPHLHDHDFHYDPRSLYSTDLRLNGLLWNLILGKDPLRQVGRVFGKAKAKNAVGAVLKMIDALYLHYPELNDSSTVASGVFYGGSVNVALDVYIDKLDDLSDPVWKAFKTKHRLNRFWQKCLLLIHYHNRFRASEPSAAEIASLLASSCRERLRIIEMLEGDNVLAQKGLINPKIPIFHAYQMELTDAAGNELHGKVSIKQEQSAKTDRLLEMSSYLSRINPSQTLEQLILDSQTKGIITSVISRLQNPNQESFAQWGLVGASLSSDPDIQHGCNILLHGVPGTGKTFIAGVIANALQRCLIQINANSIRGMFYGETEKQAREMFQEMRALAKQISPVFLLNEGDQLIHRRMRSAERSVDHTENTIQSIFLEEMESFPGIIIVTTNLCAEMDNAMSRRFHYKLEIKVPDREARMALWELHLPGSIPGAEAIPLADLAKDYPFTGGQIRLVVQNACHEAYLRGQDARLTLEDLHKYAILECGSSFEQHTRAIGFAW